MGKRCLDKVLASFRKDHRDLTADFCEILVEEAVEDMAMHAVKGKLRLDKSPTLYLQEICENKLIDIERRKKGHEVRFSTLGRAPDAASRSATTVAYVNTIASLRKGPGRIALERDLLRRVGEQVGGLPGHMREVVARIRMDAGYREIAKELGREESTIRVQFAQAISKLRELLDTDGNARRPVRLPALKRRSEDAGECKSLLEYSILLWSEFADPFMSVHVQGKRLSGFATERKQSRAEAEAILLHVYWTLWHLTGKSFPSGFRSILPRHEIYPDHQVSIQWW